ncbi:MAG: D-alanyl-D-alanine carboxypeptidase/D-alanyl-D-alanine endopeptidase [Bacteroidales bacterium]
MKTKILLLFTLFYLIFPKSYAQTEVSDFFKGADFDYSDVSVSVIDVESMKSVYNQNSYRRVIPASVLKLLTTASALGMYGGDYVFETPLRYTGNISDGILSGDLIIEGKGDPTIDSRYFNRESSFADYVTGLLKKKGIKRISGNVILDNSIYGTEVSSPKWIWEDMGNYYGAGIWGLNYKDNMYELSFRSGKAGTVPEVIAVNPEVPGMSLTPGLIAASNSKDSAYIYGAPFQKERFIYGSIPANRERFTIKGDMYDPNAVLISGLSKCFENAGIAVGGSWMTEYEKKYAGTLLDTSYPSPPLKEIVKIVNFNSNNLFADGLLRLIAQKDTQQPNTFEKGVMQEYAFWESKGLSKGGMRIFDGSGLSPLNRVTTDYLSRMLALCMKDKTIASDFYRSIPVVGKEGTVRSLFKDGSMGNRLKLKSGSMGGVLSYAGYLDKNGKRYAVVIIVNNFDVTHSVVRTRIEKWLKALDNDL